MPTPNNVKMNSSFVTDTIGTNGIYLGVDDSVLYGPTSISGFWTGYSPAPSGYVVYIKKNAQGPSIYAPASDALLLDTAQNIALSRAESPSLSTVSDALIYLNSKADMICVNMNYPNVVANGLVLLMDSAFTPSYPKGGNNWVDLSQSAKTGTLTNGVSYQTNNLGSLNFTASSAQYVDVPDLGTLSQFTVNCWFKLASLPTVAGAAAVVTNTFIGTVLNFSIGLNNSPSSANICAGFFNGAWRTTAGFAPSIGVWYNVTMTYDGTQIIQYLNGASQSTLSYSGSATSSGAGIRIGRRWDSPPSAENFIDGEIPYVSIYNRALSASEVLKNYNALASRYAAPATTTTTSSTTTTTSSTTTTTTAAPTTTTTSSTTTTTTSG